MDQDKLKKALLDTEALFKATFKEAWKECGESFTKEDQKEFQEITEAYAKAELLGSAYEVESWQCTVKAFVAREAREKGEVIWNKLNEMLVPAGKIVRSILLGLLGVSL